MNSNPKDAFAFAKLISKTRLKDNLIRFGQFQLPVAKGVKSQIRENRSGLNLLNNKHEYTVELFSKQIVEISVQLFRNNRNHFRFYAFTKASGKEGMAFSLNLTTRKESKSVIYLYQHVKFTEQYSGHEKIAKEHRQQKQFVFCEILKKMGIDVSEDNEILLGIFDPSTGKMVDINPEKLLNNFLAIALIKAHFQGNKGFELDILPSFQRYFHYSEGVITSTQTQKITKSTLIRTRYIPLGTRFKVLNRDKSKCGICGKGPKDGIVLHVDHRTPFSLGGDNTLANLWTLCNGCNIGKGNRYIT